MIRIIVMGSPEFALPTLHASTRLGQVVGVVTQPDRPAGRSPQPQPPPVKVAAEALGLPVYQPPTLRSAESQAQLAAWQPDVIVVAAFGQLLPPAALDLPPHGCLNLHASLLPRWRGAAPVAAAMMAGDPVTGVTLMRMDQGLDTGPTIARRAEPIRPDDSRATLTARLARLAADLLLEMLPAYLAGVLSLQPQPEEGVTWAPPLDKKEGRIDWRRPAVDIDRQVRAVTPWPGAFAFLQGQRLNVLQARPRPEWHGDEPPGTVLALGSGVAVATGEGALELLAVQRAGKKAMPVDAFLRGQRGLIGSLLE